MKLHTRRFGRAFGGLVLGSALTLASALPAFAADGTNVTLNGGSLSINAPSVADFEETDLTGAEQTTTATVDAFSVTDGRGSGAGWHVTAQATQFTATDDSGKTFPKNSLTMSAPTVAANGTESAAPTVETGDPYTIDGDSAVQIASAAQDEGMGQYDFSSTELTLTIPADAYAKTYGSTVTIDVVTGP